MDNKKIKLFVRVKPSAKRSGIVDLGGGHFAVSVKAAPANGQANIAALEIIARYLGVAASRVRLVAGRSARNKVFEVV